MSRLTLDTVELLDSGSLQLLANESLQGSLEHAEVQCDAPVGPAGQDTRECEGRCTLTSSRLVWVEWGSSRRDPRRSCSIPLAAIKSVAASSGMPVSSQKRSL